LQVSETAQKAERARKLAVHIGCRSGGPCRMLLLIFEPEENTVSVKLDSRYGSFSSFCAAGFKPWRRATRLPVPRGTPPTNPGPLAGLAPLPSAAKNPKGNFPPCKPLKNHKMEKESHPSPAKKTHGTDGQKPAAPPKSFHPWRRAATAGVSLA
jgi:hypothetical protein